MRVIIGKLSAWQISIFKSRGAQICACSINISGARFSGVAKKNSPAYIRFGFDCCTVTESYLCSARFKCF